MLDMFRTRGGSLAWGAVDAADKYLTEALRLDVAIPTKRAFAARIDASLVMLEYANWLTWKALVDIARSPREVAPLCRIGLYELGFGAARVFAIAFPDVRDLTAEIWFQSSVALGRYSVCQVDDFGSEFHPVRRLALQLRMELEMEPSLGAMQLAMSLPLIAQPSLEEENAARFARQVVAAYREVVRAPDQLTDETDAANH